MADKPVGDGKRLLYFLALGVPTVGRIVAVALIVAATGIAFFDLGDYPDDGSRAIAAFMLAFFALVALGITLATPSIVKRLSDRK